ncbi:MAG: hypothetical protein HY040_17855 [Planctomycetes bacterium]|nr:hypothetical protein [Planctomycetota bacterium]
MSLFSKAVKHAAGQVRHAVDDVEDAAQHVADEANKLGKRFLNGLEDFGAELEQIYDALTIGIRGLRGEEREILKRVYQGSLPPIKNILVVSLIGVSGRPFTLPASFVAAVANLILPGCEELLLALVALVAKRGECYFLFLGRSGYNDAINGFPEHDGKAGQTLVHEACHVWQGYHQLFTWGYIFNSIYYQCCTGGAYNVPDSPTAQWDHYGAEQEAVIVEKWFENGEGTGDDDHYYPYVKCNVRPGKPHATTQF